mgnify:CR=1 FL=1
MAMMDYGVIAKKNGKIINNDLFTDMKDTLGFECEKDNRGKQLNGNYFIYLGDEDFFIAFYKGMFNVFKDRNKLIDTILDIDAYVPLELIRYPIKKYRYKRIIDNVEFDIKRLDEGNRYKVRFYYKKDLYEVIYGYGVDLDIKSWYDLTQSTKNKVLQFLNN